VEKKLPPRLQKSSVLLASNPCAREDGQWVHKMRLLWWNCSEGKYVEGSPHPKQKQKLTSVTTVRFDVAARLSSVVVFHLHFFEPGSECPMGQVTMLS